MFFDSTGVCLYNATMNVSSSQIPENRRFVTTQWSCVIQAAGNQSEHSRLALEQLCQHYWYPLYAFVRRKGHDAADAADLTQGFFVHLLEGNRLEVCDQTRGKFRSFLMKSMTHFITTQWRRETAQKRGGGKTLLQIDFELADAKFQNDPVDELTPEKLFERQWALSILEQAMSELKQDYVDNGKDEQFDALQSQIGGSGKESYAQIAEKLGMTEGAIKVAVHRLRDRYRKKLREVVAQTLNLSESKADRSASFSDPAILVDREIKELFKVLG